MHYCLSLHVYSQRYRGLLQEEVIQLPSSGWVSSQRWPPLIDHNGCDHLSLVLRPHRKDRSMLTCSIDLPNNVVVRLLTPLGAVSFHTYRH